MYKGICLIDIVVRFCENKTFYEIFEKCFISTMNALCQNTIELSEKIIDDIIDIMNIWDQEGIFRDHIQFWKNQFKIQRMDKLISLSTNKLLISIANMTNAIGLKKDIREPMFKESHFH